MIIVLVQFVMLCLFFKFECLPSYKYGLTKQLIVKVKRNVKLLNCTYMFIIDVA